MPAIHRRCAAKTLATASLALWLQRPLQGFAAEDPTASGSDGDGKTNPPLPYLDRLGLQLYTVRQQMADDPETTLQAVADAGYKQVELMQVNDAAVGLAAIARDKGLIVHSAFIDFNVIAEPTLQGVASVEQTLELAERIGLRHVVFGYIARHQRDTADKCKAIADRANDAARKTREAGMRMCYHNHAFEFAPLEPTGQTGDDSNPPAQKGKSSVTAFDLFTQRFDPQVMEFELDVFWARLAGKNPLELMKRLSGRISQVHLKDLKAGVPVIFDEGKVPRDAFQEIGDGIIDMPDVMRLAREIGVDQCHVEQDQSPAPLASIRESADYLLGNAS